jgi:hypothetical protein
LFPFKKNLDGLAESFDSAQQYLAETLGIECRSKNLVVLAKAGAVAMRNCRNFIDASERAVDSFAKLREDFQDNPSDIDRNSIADLKVLSDLIVQEFRVITNNRMTRELMFWPELEILVVSARESIELFQTEMAKEFDRVQEFFRPFSIYDLLKPVRQKSKPSVRLNVLTSALSQSLSQMEETERQLTEITRKANAAFASGYTSLMDIEQRIVVGHSNG